MTAGRYRVFWIDAAAGFDFYTQVAKDYGILGRMKFAMLTKLPSEQAAKLADSPGNIELFEQSLTQLRLEMKK